MTFGTSRRLLSGCSALAHGRNRARGAPRAENRQPELASIHEWHELLHVDASPVRIAADT
jgi:hypothetical protein